VRAPVTTRIRPFAAALLAVLAAAPAARAHEGNPNYLSQVDAITPATDGVTIEVLNRDDRLLLHNTSGEDVVIEATTTSRTRACAPTGPSRSTRARPPTT
jgi:hypothetical protein